MPDNFSIADTLRKHIYTHPALGVQADVVDDVLADVLERLGPALERRLDDALAAESRTVKPDTKQTLRDNVATAIADKLIGKLIAPQLKKRGDARENLAAARDALAGMDEDTLDALSKNEIAAAIATLGKKLLLPDPDAAPPKPKAPRPRKPRAPVSPVSSGGWGGKGRSWGSKFYDPGLPRPRFAWESALRQIVFNYRYPKP